MKYGSDSELKLNLDFDGMQIYGSNRLSILTMKYPGQADNLIRIYDATEGAETVDKLLRFIGRYGNVEPGMLNLSGHILTTALKSRKLTPDEEARVIGEINQTAFRYGIDEIFGYFPVPFGEKNPKVRMIVRGQDYGSVIVAIDARDKKSYKLLVEEPAERVLGNISWLREQHGSTRSIIEGVVTDL